MRVSWDRYFLDIANAVSTRATCDRKNVGAVLVKDRVILSTGYNGAPRGMAHCDVAGHAMEDGHCVRTVHAEVNAVVQAARSGASTVGATLYTNTFPCWNCAKVLISAGVERVVAADLYRAGVGGPVFQAFAESNVQLSDPSVGGDQ